MTRVVVLASVPVVAFGHAAMLSPPSWADPEGKYVSSNDWTEAGCGDTPDVPEDSEHKKEGCVYQWYTNYTYIPESQQPTIPKDSILRTYTDCPNPRDPTKPFASVSEDNCRVHPWAAPGTAPVHSPCGVDGGNVDGCPAGNPGKDGCAIGGYGHGPDAREFYQGRPHVVTEWSAGSVVEVKMALTANHGGGYSYRICPKPDKYMDLTEECFQAGSLEFVGNTSWAVWNGDDSDRTEIPAYGISLPTGHWRQVPAPACNDSSGGAVAPPLYTKDFFDICVTGYQFPPRAYHRGRFGIKHALAGFSGVGPILGKYVTTSPMKPWTIVDKVKVPENLHAGDYVLSFRSDVEQTPQVWTVCGDIKILESTVAV